MEQGSISFVDPAECKSFVYDPAGILYEHECDGVHQRRICLLGFDILHERKLVEPPAACQEVEMERSILFPRPMGTSDRQEQSDEWGEGLYLFPNGSYTLGKAPYMEASIGIENIFKFLRLDYVWRLNYRDHPGIQTKGVRFMMRMSF